MLYIDIDVGIVLVTVCRRTLAAHTTPEREILVHPFSALLDPGP